jgi:hypothetical protein
MIRICVYYVSAFLMLRFLYFVGSFFSSGRVVVLNVSIEAEACCWQPAFAAARSTCFCQIGSVVI